MTATAQHSVSEVLGYQDRLPLSWRPVSPEDPSHTELFEEAHRVLAACAILEEARRRRDDEGSVEVELDRLHMKVNIVIDMLGSLIAAGLPRPPALPVWMSAEGLLWLQTDESIIAGTEGLVSVHLHRSLPRPLVLPARIQHSGGGEISARFEHLTHACQSELERHVFLRHRRAVAGSRTPPNR